MGFAFRKAGGSALMSSGRMVYIGERVALGGIILQFVSYGFFCVLLVKNHISIRLGNASPAYESCRMIISALYFSSAFISVRSPSF